MGYTPLVLFNQLISKRAVKSFHLGFVSPKHVHSLSFFWSLPPCLIYQTKPVKTRNSSKWKQTDSFFSFQRLENNENMPTNPFQTAQYSNISKDLGLRLSCNNQITKPQLHHSGTLGASTTP